MADIHVRTGEGQQWIVVMHLAVPNANNDIGVNYRDALVASGIGGTTVMTEGVAAWEILTAEKADVEAGVLHEHVATFPIESGGKTVPQLRASLREFYAVEEARVIEVLKARLRYFGHTETQA